jgi:hypothetical protein
MAHETQAYGVGAAALLPWHSFFHQINKGGTRAKIAAQYEVSEDLVEYRIKISGAHKLYQARQRALGGSVLRVHAGGGD